MSLEQALTGIWYNELGSIMNLTASNGSLTGLYNSAKGAAQGNYNLVGLYDPNPPSDEGTTLSWTIQWVNSILGNSHSNVAQNGQFHANDGETKYIRTMWFLSSSSSSDEEWGSVQAGLDTFTPIPPTNEKVKAKQARVAAFANGQPV